MVTVTAAGSCVSPPAEPYFRLARRPQTRRLRLLRTESLPAPGRARRRLLPGSCADGPGESDMPVTRMVPSQARTAGGPGQLVNLDSEARLSSQLEILVRRSPGGGRRGGAGGPRATGGPVTFAVFKSRSESEPSVRVCQAAAAGPLAVSSG